MADPPRPRRRASLSRGLRYIFIGFISLGLSVGPMLPTWFMAEPPDDPFGDDPDEPTEAPAQADAEAAAQAQAQAQPPAPARPAAVRPYAYRPGAALSPAEQAAWVQLVRRLARNLGPAIDLDRGLPGD